jgi:hypothetical protein
MKDVNINISQKLHFSVLNLGLKYCKNLRFSQSEHSERATSLIIRFIHHFLCIQDFLFESYIHDMNIKTEMLLSLTVL